LSIVKQDPNLTVSIRFIGLMKRELVLRYGLWSEVVSHLVKIFEEFWKGGLESISI